MFEKIQARVISNIFLDCYRPILENALEILGYSHLRVQEIQKTLNTLEHISTFLVFPVLINMNPWLAQRHREIRQRHKCFIGTYGKS